MDKNNKTSLLVTGFLLFFAGLISGLSAWLFERHKAKNNQETLLQQNQDLTDQLKIIQNQVSFTKTKQPLTRQEWKYLISGLLIILLAGVGPILVMADRWFKQNPHFGWTDWVMGKIPFFLSTSLPAYIIAITFITPIVVLLFFFLTPTIKLPTIFVPSHRGEISLDVPAINLKLSNALSLFTVVAMLLEVVGFVFYQRAPGAEYGVIILLFLIATVFLKIPSTRIHSIIKSIPGWSLPAIFLLLSWLLVLMSIFQQKPFTWVSFFIFLISLYVIKPHLKQISLLFWLCAASLVLYSFHIDSWRYAIIGDEYSFHTYGKLVLLQEDFLSYSFKNLFNPKPVIYGKFVYLSVLPNILSMALFGVKNFGWRIINAILVISSVPFFYLFVKQFLGKKIAIIFAVLFLSSQYLINFSKIGYNNLTALWMMSVLLWVMGITIKNPNRITFTILGFTLGLSLYMYPTIYAILPIVIVFLLVYRPPWASTLSRHQWFSMIAMFSVLFFPLMFEPNYWQIKWGESALFITNGMSPLFHIFQSLYYSFLSPIIAPQESHFVVSSYLDPLSGLFSLVGLSWVIKNIKKDRFYPLLLVSILIASLIITGARSHMVPAITHMFLLLPFFMILAAIGLYWVFNYLPPRPLSSDHQRIWLFATLMVVLSLNLVQAYWVSSTRSDQYYSHESLTLRLMSEIQRDNSGNRPTNVEYVFITDQSWNIEGIRHLQEVYDLPPSSSQLFRSPVYTVEEKPTLNYTPVWVTLPPPANPAENENVLSMKLEHWVTQMIQRESTVFIAPPYLSDEEFKRLEIYLNDSGRKTCPIQAMPNSEVRLNVWFSKAWQSYCPENGSWPHYW